MTATITPQRHGPWAIVAGASEGIGAAFARRIAAAGVNVVLVARREGLLTALGRELHERHGVEALAVPLDLSARGAERELFDATGDIDVGLLVYNAGADDHAAFFLEVEAEEWAALVRRNCIAPMLAAHHFGAKMVERGRGGLMVVTSGAGWAGGARITAYAASKAFDLVLGESLWAEWSDKGVDVLSLVVGPTATPPFLQILEERGITLEGLADPDDVAREGLEHLGEGPTWQIGMPEGSGPSPLGALPRRDAVQLMSAGTDAVFGPRT